MTHSKLIHDGYEDQINNLIEQRNEARTECDALKAQNTRLITEMSEALGDKTLNSLSQVATGIRDLQAEIDALKAQNAELLAAQEGTPCKHKFNAVVGGVLSCTHCYASFSDQQAAIAKARGDL